MLKGVRIALVEDDEIMGASLVQRLELEGAQVIWFRQAVRALGGLRTPRVPIDAVICDIRLPDGSGEEVYATLCQTTTPPPFLFITGHAGVDQAVRLMQAGAADYVTKPFKMAVFLERLSMLVSGRAQPDLPPLLGISPAAKRVDTLAQRAARTDRPVLIRGGPGTGKALVARRIHQLSDRCAAPFIEVNLARDPDAAATMFSPGGAIEQARDGVVFFNAIGGLQRDDQAALMRGLDAGIEARILCASGIEIDDLVAEGAFRSDLFVRLAATDIPIPPLGQRPDDALWLMAEFFERLNSTRPVPLKGISRFCENAVRDHDWPGGGREVRSRLVRGMDTTDGPVLQPVDLFPERLAAGDRILTLAEARNAAERRQISEALEHTDGHIGKAAKLLQVSRTTLWEKMQKLHITPPAP